MSYNNKIVMRVRAIIFIKWHARVIDNKANAL